jgi:L-fucose isomerase-like protein
MNSRPKVGFVCFGEVNTPYGRLEILRDDALRALDALRAEIVDVGIVTDDPSYETAEKAIGKLRAAEFSSLIICIAGWVPTHAVIKVTDVFRHMPMALWGLKGWREGDLILSTAPQAGSTAARGAFDALGYTFKYVYSAMDEPHPVAEIDAFTRAAHAAACLRNARVGSMGYRDMLLYGTQFEGNSMRGQLGVEVETFEMLEMVGNIEKLDQKDVDAGVEFVKDSWVIDGEVDDAVIGNGVKYALAIGMKIKERGYEAVTLLDVDGMKKLMGFPPAMVFMLLDHYYGVQVTPENDVMGNVTQLMLHYITGERIQYLEYYEFLKESMIAGVPDFIIKSVTDGDVHMLPAAFGMLSASLSNVSKVRPGYVTCARLYYKNGQYYMHMYTGDGKRPPKWTEFGWDDPVPVLPSLEIAPDSCTVAEFADKVTSQHVIVAYGDQSEPLKDLCRLLDIEIA